MPERDIDEKPYSKDEARVAKWLSEIVGVGGGDDPIGFLMASYEFKRGRVKEAIRKWVKHEASALIKMRLMPTDLEMLTSYIMVECKK